jgi:hypothetical protein
MHECRHELPAFGLSGCYADLKERARAGEQLSREELDFIGHYRPRSRTNGWHEPNNFADFELDRDELSAEDITMMQALMDVGAS